MAVYNLSNQPKKEKTSQEKNKTIGIILISIASVAFFALLTNFIGFLRSFLLGTFGLFSYPMFIVTFVIGVAFVNNNKYVMTAKYIVYLLGAILSLLCILHMLTIDTSGTFFEYLGRCYSQKMTAGGILCGILTAPFIFILNNAGAYIIYSLALVVFGALIADYIYYLKKSQIIKSPIAINNDIKVIEPPVVLVKEPKQIEQTEKPKPEVNVVLDAKKEEEPKEDEAKRKLGLIKTNIQEPEKGKEEKPKVDYSGKSLKEILLTPDEQVDMTKYSGKAAPIVTPQVKQTFEELKEEKIEEKKTIISNPAVPQTYNEPNLEVPKQPEVQEPIIEKKEEPKQDDDFFNNVLKDLNEENRTEQKPEVRLPETRPKLDSTPKPKMEQLKIIEEKPQPVKPKKHIRYVPPSLDLLTTQSMDLSELSEDVAQKRIQLENALDTFGIPAKVIEVVVGPAVTRYELEMPIGISVKKILAHSDDIALHLAANGDIRIEAPIPGKSAVGIEVPNEKIATIGLKDMIASMEFQTAKAPLTFVLGKDIAGTVRLCNLAKMPHLLVAGSTGSGKSVCMNAVILSLIYKTSPDDVRLILIDPKQVEFSIYNGLPHLLIPNVITDSEKALNSLSWAVNEMERRYTLFMNTRTKDITEYNVTSDVVEGRAEKLPYIVIMIDEVADLLMTSKKDVEEKIARLAQKSRAAGIHLILATQRPSVDVITGTMKNNFTSRISFKLMSFADSKTILDQGGAEKLLGKGDMLYKPSDAGDPRRIQGCFVTSAEVANIVDFVKERNKDYDYDSVVETQIMNPPKQDTMSMANGEPPSDTGFDPLMPQALKCVIENGQASISMLQRRLVIGYPRAARIIDQMQDSNFISAQEGSKPRTVLITMEQYEEMFGDEEWQKKNY